MGFRDRLGSILKRGGHIVAGTVHGAYEAVEAVPGAALDLVKAPFVDDEYGGFVDTLVGVTQDRTGQILKGVAGENSGLEQLVGGLPGQVRSPVRWAGEQAETVYRNTISEPLSTAFTAASLASEDSFFGGDFFKGSTWRQAYGIAQHRSPGQAFALMFGPDDVTNQEQVDKFLDSNFGTVTSGLFDLGVRWKYDPTVIAGKTARRVHTAKMVKPITGAEDFDLISRSKRLREFNQRLDGLTADQIRHGYFPDHRHGAAISTILAEAGDEATRMAALRGMMGDLRELDRIGQVRADVANQIRRTMGDKDALRALDDANFVIPGTVMSDEIARLNSELDALYDAQKLADRRNDVFAAIREQPRVTLGGDIRRTVTTSHYYQHSRTAAPLRVVFNMNPHHLVNLEDQTGDIQIARMLRGSDLDETAQGALRAKYMAATDATQRETVLLEAEAAGVRSIAEKAGMTVGEIDDLLKSAGKMRGTALEALKQRAYDGEGRSIVRLRGDGAPVDMPLTVSQQANVLPLVDLDKVRKATEPIGRWRLRHPTADLPEEFLNDVMRVWRPATLLRAGWPARVLMDEHLRMLGIYGGLAYMHGWTTMMGNKLADFKTRRRTGDKPDWVPGKRELEIDGYKLPGAFDDPVYKTRVSARDSFDQQLGRNADGIVKRMHRTGRWTVVDPDDAAYGKAWEDAVNRQIGSDPLARQIAAGSSVDDAVSWLRGTEQGQKYARRMRWRLAEQDMTEWVGHVADQVHAYLPTPALRELALKRRATAKELARQVPSGVRPPVHGELLDQLTGRSATLRAVGRLTDRMYHAFGSAPTDVLSRQPFFDAAYQAEVRRLVGLHGRQRTISAAQLDDIAKTAREYALGETKTYLYDLAEQSRLADMLRFVSPFYSAWQEVITRWVDIGSHNPAYVARLRLAYQSPEKAGLLVTDDQGNSYIKVPVSWTHSIPGIGDALKSQDTMLVGRDSINMALSLPGAGPIVQVPVRQLVKNRPDLQDDSVIRFIFPYGVPRNTRDMLLPGYARRAYSAALGEEDQAYRNVMLRIFISQQVDFNLGKRSAEPSWEEAKKEADAFYKLRIAASFFSPAALSFQTPYQPYIDAYRALRDADPATADQKFLDIYGEEYFPLTQALTKAVDGVPSTQQGLKARKHYEELIEKHPELGGLIVGAEGAGEFSRAAYEFQLQNAVSPSSDLTQRRPLSKEEVEAGPNVRLGWMEYAKAMDILDAELDARGLANMQQAAAADLRETKQAVIEGLRARYPQWYDRFAVTDRGAWAKKLEGMRDVVASPLMQHRPDVRGLAEYLNVRNAILAELAAREHHSLTAAANADVRETWEAAVSQIAAANPAFSALYHRWLENDPVRVED